MGVTEDNTDLGWGSTLLGELADLVDNLIPSLVYLAPWCCRRNQSLDSNINPYLLRGGLEPCWWSTGVWNGGGRNALSLGVKSSHCD